MNLTRKEFNERYKGVHEETRTVEEVWPTEKLISEIREDAPFRNRAYLFDGSDLKNVPVTGNSSGAKTDNPHIGTEDDRMRAIRMEVWENTYEPIEITAEEGSGFFRTEDGFHRIVIAHRFGIKTMRVRIHYGRFVLNEKEKRSD